jgi:hypothetical protein
MLQTPCCTFILKVRYQHSDHHLGLLDPCKWDQQVVPKCRHETAILRSVEFQSSAPLVYTAAEAEMRHHNHSYSVRYGVEWWLVINELERLWKEVVVAHFQLLSKCKLLWCRKCAPCNNLFEHSPQTDPFSPKQDGWHLQRKLDLIVRKQEWKLMHIERYWRLLLPGIAPVVFIYNGSRAPMSHRSLLTTKKCAAICRVIGGDPW